MSTSLSHASYHLLLKQLQTDLQAQKEFSESLIRSAYEMIIRRHGP